MPEGTRAQGEALPRLSRRRDCRLCASPELSLALSLTPTPPANAFVPASETGKRQETYPLDVFLCRSCGHLQLLDVVDPALLFENYVYVSGTSQAFVKHFEAYAGDLLRRFSPRKGSLVLDVGSNDGTLLRFFKEGGMRVLGVDPAREIAAAATRSGIETLPAFFAQDLARRLRQSRGSAALITANNVFAHADDLRGFVAGVRELLAPDGVFVFEVSYLADVVAKTLFDTIYHEHLAYHSVRPLRRFLAEQGLELVEALRVAPHGGSLRGIAQRLGDAHPVGASVAEAVALEEGMGLDRMETFRGFAAKIEALKARLQTRLRELKARGKRIAGFGAPAKATTLMHHFGLGRETIEFVADDSPLKQGLFTPGTHVPVLPPSAIYERRPEVLLILAWNFAEPIMARHKAFRESGGSFLVPLPEIQES